MSRTTNRVTIKDVADKAGVSIATVSRIINHKDAVTPDTRQRVLDTMELLNFIPRSIPTITDSNNKVILMCIPDFINPFNAQIIRGVQKVAHFHKYDVLFLQADDFYTSAGDYINIIKNNAIAGVLMFSPVPNSALIDELNSRCPMVMCSDYYDGYSQSFVGIDDISAAKSAVNYLISTGCHKIGLINSFHNNKYARHREKGFCEALTEAGLPINQDWIAHISSISYQSALSKATHILSLEDRPDAFFATSDVYAVGVINAAKKMGLVVPEDLSVIGFDNVEISIMTDPQITTIEQPSYQIGYQSCELLIDKIMYPETSDKHIILDTELIVRQSTKFNSQFNPRG